MNSYVGNLNNYVEDLLGMIYGAECEDGAGHQAFERA